MRLDRDTDARPRLARYMNRAPLSLDKMTNDANSATVIYRSKLHATLKRNFQLMSRKYAAIRLGIVVITIVSLLGWRDSLAADSELTQPSIYKLPPSGSSVYRAFYISVSGTSHQYIETEAGQKTSPFVLEINGIAREDFTEEIVVKLMSEGWTWTLGDWLSDRYFAIDGPSDVRKTLRRGEKDVFYSVDDDQSYTLNLKAQDEGIVLEVYYGMRSPESATFFLRYHHLFLPEGIDAQLTLSPEGVTPLFLDKDGDGTYETPIEPTWVAIGNEQVDVTPPRLSYEKKRQGGVSIISLSAADEKSGVRRILYTLDQEETDGGRSFKLYSTPIRVPSGEIKKIRVFAEDNAGNQAHTTIRVN